MTNKDTLGALDWINWKIKEAHKLGIERVPVYETIRQALEVNQELVNFCDLMVDEFYRIIALKPSHEIIGICDRAVSTTKQKIPLIKQRDDAISKYNKFAIINQELVEALKEAVRLWDEHKATHEYHITSWKQAIARAEQKGSV